MSNIEASGDADDAVRPGPLTGVTVVDLGQIYQGPYATLLMAMAGARVIKVEPPDGEALRRRERVGLGASFPIAILNSCKEAVTLNLKTERGRALLGDMVSRADVLLENYAPGVLDRLGCGADVLMERNPQLIYASGSGFGLSGPDKDSLAMDLTVQAVSGVMSVTGLGDGPPLKAGPAIADFLSGIHLYGAVTTALFERERTGRGRVVEVAMQEAVFPSLTSNLGMLQDMAGAPPPRTGNRHGGLAIAPYNVYACADGHIAVICVKEGHWQNLLKVMGRTDLADDPRFIENAARVENLDATDQLVQDWASGLTRAEIFQVTRENHVPSAPVRDLTEVVDDAHMHERGMLARIDHPDFGEVVLPSSPLRYHGTPQAKPTPHPKIGEHNEGVYGDWLGLDQTEIAALKRDGVI